MGCERALAGPAIRSEIPLDPQRAGQAPAVLGGDGSIGDAGDVSVRREGSDIVEALALTLYFSGRPAEGRAAADKALAIAPYDAEILNELGPRIAQAGEWQMGRELLHRAIDLNPANAGYYAGHLAFIAYMLDDVRTAASLIARTNHKQFALRYLVEALIAAERGDIEGAAQARARFQERAPGFMARLDDEISRRNMTAADAAKLRTGLVKAGYSIAR